MNLCANRSTVFSHETDSESVNSSLRHSHSVRGRISEAGKEKDERKTNGSSVVKQWQRQMLLVSTAHQYSEHSIYRNINDAKLMI